jgi:hypothetical protein
MPIVLLEALGEFLLGVAAGLLLTFVASADEMATERCAQVAQWRVDRLHAEADRRVAGVYERYSPWMGPETRQAYVQRLGVW